MAQHISVRVPWHDNGWNGEVCKQPACNSSCLRLVNIYENRKDSIEDSICGECMAGHEADLPCIGEGSAFMSSVELVKTTIHPYKKYKSAEHMHFTETDITYLPYSFVAKPFGWMMKDRIEAICEEYGIAYNGRKEPVLKWNTNWVQEASNHRAIFNYFYGDVIPNQSLCVAYAKQVPFIEDSRRVVVAMGYVKNIAPAVEHNHTEEGTLRSMTWETMVCHSIRQDHKEGFVIPYKEMMEYAENHPEFDMADITVFAPEDSFAEFSYATEHVGYDAIIDVILSCIKAFEIINKCLDEDYSNVLTWLNMQLAQVWEDRGAFPGLGAMLCAIGMPMGILIAKEIKESLSDSDEDIWKYVNEVIAKPYDYLSETLAIKITAIVQITWKNLTEERKTLFYLLSRFSLSINQAYMLFNESEREKQGVKCSDREIIEDPYIVFEQTRLKNDEYYISVKKVDRAVFPVATILDKYPVLEPSKLTSDNDQRRIRAISVAVLEQEALKGNTIMPRDLLVNRVNDLILEPACRVTKDILKAIQGFVNELIMEREMKDGTEYYKLVRIHDFDEIIEKRVRKRLSAEPHAVDTDWRKLLDSFLKQMGVSGEITLKEELARKEKSACLEVLAKSRVSVLVGDAGTGKTTVLAALCTEPSIKAGGVLLLAPTGKATVRLMESMGKNGASFDALNVAQFLARGKRFDFEDMRYCLSDYKFVDTHETVIIDEASMLTEEMFGAMMQTLSKAKRIIFVGDPNQLPPIGAGRPFVDLVHLLKEDLPANIFPKVCKSYGELTVNRRQASEDERADVRLSKQFTDGVKEEDDVITHILMGDNEHIRFEQWAIKEELEQKLLKVLQETTNMKDTDDIDGFNASLGGEKSEYVTFFNMGCANNASDWQILAPVRNMPQGVMYMNRFIHEKYREKNIKTSGNIGKYKRIPKALGSEKIVYGDKVINVVNGGREGYPPEEAINYVANGEIGIACNSYRSTKPNDYLHVEFSTQQGVTYSYTKKDFDEESGTANLELAYALTVHKAQGSQFNTVILVISEPCRIISKEMLYTALTRQFEKVVILYNKDPHELLKYSSEEYSDISRRFTDLFASVFLQEGKDYRPQIVQVGDNFYEDRLIHHTIEGEMVRSKSEVIIANCLHYNELEYEYEPVLELEPGKPLRPDFKITDGDTGEVWYWEHCGMMNDSKYAKRWEDKKKFYDKHGIKEEKNLIVTYDDENGGLDSSYIDNLIKDTFGL